MELLRLMSLAIALALSSGLEFRREWHAWKTQHSRWYGSRGEELQRHKVWLRNREYILNHNKNVEHHGYSLSLNRFADLTDEQFVDQFLSYRRLSRRERLKLPQFVPEDEVESTYEELDWRDLNAVTPVQDQGWCGSSYAFSSIGAIEGMWATQKGSLRNLSAQNIVDCSVIYGNLGCLGGNMYTSFEYVYKNGGIDDASFYPYTGWESTCAFEMEEVTAQINGSQVIKQGNENDLKVALAKFGPVSVAVDASDTTFSFYEKGVYDAPNCSRLKVNHAMLVVGYGNLTYTDYWTVKNSWGGDWGMDGYIYMTRNVNNQCGIATDASFPIVSSTT